MEKSRIHSQFFHRLVPGFHTQLTIPEDFFSKFIEEICVVELKSDISERTWKVNLTGRSFTEGWEEFVVANDFRIGDVVVFRCVEDNVFHVSDLGPNYSEIQGNEGKNLLKKRLHSRTQVEFSSNDGDVDDVEDNIEVHREKKAKTNSLEEEEEEAGSCFVSFVTASSLCTDTVYLHFTSSNGLPRECREIVLTDGGERSWALDLKFNESSDAFYISRGWRNFCDENGQKTGGFFTFKLVENGETPVFSFCPTESINDRRERDSSEATRRESVATKLSEEENIAGESSEDACSSLESLMEIAKRNFSLKRRGYSSYSPTHKRFLTFTLPQDYLRIRKLCLPLPFLRENGINKPGEIYLLGKDGRKWLTYLRLDKKGTYGFGKGWKEFVKANVVETSFALKLIWEETTPVLSLCSVESSSDREQEEFSKAIEKQSLSIDPSNKGKISNDENNKEENLSWERKRNNLKWRDSTPSSRKQFVTLTITPYSVQKSKLRLSTIFTRENGIDKPGIITLLGKDGIKHQTNLLLDKTNGSMHLGVGWKDFVKDNGLKTGDSFTLKLLWEDNTPVLSLCPAECSIDTGEGGQCSETNQKTSLPIEPSSCEQISKEENIKDEERNEDNNKEEREESPLRWKDSAPSSQKQFVTLTITPSSVKQNRLCLSKIFTRENGIDKPGIVTLLGKDGIKHQTSLLFDKTNEKMSLGMGWKDFVKDNGLKTGDSFTLKLIWEDKTPVLSLCPAEFIDTGAGGQCSETNQEMSLPIEPSSCEKISEEENVKDEERKEDNNKEEGEESHSTAPSLNRFMTIRITPNKLKEKRLRLPMQFARENNMNKPGIIYLLGKDGKRWMANLVRERNNQMTVGTCWKEFAEVNDFKSCKSCTLELIWEEATPVLSLLSTEFSSSDANKKESVSTESRSRDSSPTIENRFVTLALTSEDVVKAGILILPSQFLKANGINKLGKITLLGENGVQWSGYLLRRDGFVALGIGWEGFCEANGVKLGDSFTLEYIDEQDTTPILKFSSLETKVN